MVFLDKRKMIWGTFELRNDANILASSLLLHFLLNKQLHTHLIMLIKKNMTSVINDGE
jgi:hypothetical protein